MVKVVNRKDAAVLSFSKLALATWMDMGGVGARVGGRVRMRPRLEQGC